MHQPANNKQYNSHIVRKTPFYYGWIILAVSSLGMFMTTPGQTLGVSIFLDSIITDLDLSRSQVALMYTFGTLAGSFLLPFVGRFIDKRGPRLSVAIIVTLFALACIYMGFIRNLLMLFLGFFFIRSMGQGSLSLVSNYTINQWFIRRRGLAIGLAGFGFAIATAVFPPAIEFLLQNFGWRQSYMILGLVLATTMLPLGILFFRSAPEHYGLKPDGTKQAEAVSEYNATPQEARSSLIFWLLSAAIFLTSALGTGLLFHHYSIMEQVGLNRESALLLFIPLGFTTFASNFITGLLLDRFPPRFMLAFAQFMLAVSLAFASFVFSAPTILVYGVIFGIMQGATGAISNTAFAHYFGRQYLGEIKGTVQTINVAGSAFGPFLFAIFYQQSGSYIPVLLFSMIPPLAIALATLIIPRRMLVPTQRV